MAIAYKSAGTGSSTQTTATNLTPTYPATVDAGDIAIMHVFWENTVPLFSFPAGWDILNPSGSSGEAIQTVATHWVLGRIAAGTEDGATVTFGTAADTNQRAARIYTFSGRISGAIADLVNGFDVTTHATDPQMPTVTTTQAGSLAVALVAQNDNNAHASATGETGGDWTEAVTEYTVGLTPGFTISIQTCTPTDDPGTVTGGAMATTNDPAGVIGFQIRDSVPVVTDVPNARMMMGIGL